ncbi:MAG: quinolinate synthase NadA, partial [Selenomonadales bacterium]|nr:quinolinate synthase NadA [Selenomonadales bacterium]
MNNLVAEIKRLKQERNAVILAHIYQPAEIQDIADFIGDSLDLSRRAAETDADVIVFCGVHFMAETANILSPDKIVLLPDITAGCEMADMITAEELAKKRAENPDAVVVSYVNTTAAVKALTDICCTSANAVQIVESIPKDKDIIFAPDRNLGGYIARSTNRTMDLWDGCCPIHHALPVEEVLKAKEAHPNALVLAHPECRDEVLALADHINGTMGLVRFAEASDADEFIVVTVRGTLHQMNKRCPNKKFYLASEMLDCHNMSNNSLEKVKTALETLSPQVVVPEDVRVKAKACL